MSKINLIDEILDASEIKILNSIQELVAIYGKNLKLLWVNKASAESVNLKPKDMIGRYCYKFWESEKNPCEGCPVIKTLESGKKEELIRRSKDDRIWDLKAYPIFNEENAIIGVLEIGLDITEKTEIQRELQESEKKYRVAYKQLDFYEDLFHHDLNNIFQSLLSSIELSHVFKKDRKFEKLENVLNLAKNQILRARLLISNVHNLIDLDKSDPQLEMVDLKKYLKSSIYFIENTYEEKNINIQVSGINGSIFVLADKRLEDVFVNILKNSVEHNKNKYIKIEIILSYVNTKHNKFLKIQIIDNGPGIHDEVKRNIIQHINGKNAIQKRFGLGLILVKKILNSYGAKLFIKNKIKNDYSKGTNIVIQIPLLGKKVR